MVPLDFHKTRQQDLSHLPPPLAFAKAFKSASRARHGTMEKDHAGVYALPFFHLCSVMFPAKWVPPKVSFPKTTW